METNTHLQVNRVMTKAIYKFVCDLLQSFLAIISKPRHNLSMVWLGCRQSNETIGALAGVSRYYHKREFFDGILPCNCNITVANLSMRER